MSDEASPDEILSRLESQYKHTRLIHIIQRGDGPPRVQWDPALSENDVIANIVKALLFMTIDEYILEIFDDMVDEGLDDA